MNTTNKKIPFTVVALGLVSFFTDASSEMIYPLLPLFVLQLGKGAVVLGVIEGVAEMVASILKLFAGIWADKMKHKKKLVLLGYGISTIARPLIAFVTNAWQIVFIRFSDRVGKGIRSAPRDAIIASVVNDQSRGKAYGFHRAMDHAGAVVGPMISLIILIALFAFFDTQSDFSRILRITFLCAFIPGIIAMLILFFLVKENPNESKGLQLPNFSLKLFDNNFLKYLGVLLIFTLGNSSDAFLLYKAGEIVKSDVALLTLLSSFPPVAFLLEKVGETHRTMMLSFIFIPLLWSFFHILKSILSTPLSGLSDTIGRKKVIIYGWTIYALVYLGFASLDFISNDYQFIAIVILFSIYAFFYAFTEGTEKAFVADLVPSNVRGSAFGIFNLMIGIGALPASVIFGVLYGISSEYGSVFAFGLGATLALIATILLKIYIKEPKAS